MHGNYLETTTCWHTQSSVSEENILDLELKIGIEWENAVFYDDEATLIIILSLTFYC